MSVCSYCEEALAILTCDDCGDIFCQECFGVLHAKGKWKTHTSTPIVSVSSENNEQQGGEEVPHFQQEGTPFQPVEGNQSQEEIQEIQKNNNYNNNSSLEGISNPLNKSLEGFSNSLNKSFDGPKLKGTDLKMGLKLKGKPIMKPTSPNLKSSSKPISQMAQMLKLPAMGPKPTQTKNSGAFGLSSFAPQKKRVDLNSSGYFGFSFSSYISPDRIRITISEPSKGLKSRFLFSKFSSLKEVLTWTCQNLLGIQYPSSLNDDMFYYQLKFQNVWLDQNRSLFSYGITESSELILEERKRQTKKIKIRTPWQRVPGLAIKADEGTGIWALSQQVLKTLFKHGFPNDQSSEYGLYLNNELLNEFKLLNEFGDNLENLEFKLQPLPQTSEIQIDVLFINKTHTVSFDQNTTVGQAISTFIKKIGLSESPGLFSIDSFSLVQIIQEGNPINLMDSFDSLNDSFFAEEEIWLENYQKLSEISNLQVVELRKRVLTYDIEFEDGTCKSLSFDHKGIVRDCLDMISENSSYKDLTNYGLYNGNDELRPERTLKSYNLEDNTLSFQRKLYELIVLNDEQGQIRIKCDYSKPLKQYLNTIWNEFVNFEGKEPSEKWTLRRLSPDTALDLEKSLSSQGILEGGTIILKVDIVIVKKEPSFLDKANEVNIWEESSNSSTVMYDSENNNRIKAGTLNKLVDYLTEKSDFEYQGSFLLSYRSFTTPEMLYRKLIEKFKCPENEKNTKLIQLRVLNIFKHWMEKSYSDFSHDLVENLTSFIDSLPNEHAPFASAMRRSLLQRSCGLKATSSNNFLLRGTHPEPILKLSKNLKGPPEIWDYDDLEIARQLTIIEFHNFERIQPLELLNQRWTKHPQETPNIVRATKKSTQISLWVSASILEQTRAKLRAKRWAKLVKIAQNLRSFNNFSTLMAFIAGWNNAAVARLYHTKNFLPKSIIQSMQNMENEMSPNQSSKSYRNALTLSNPPIVPYLGTHLSDLTFIDEGNQDLLSGLINVNKRVLCFKVISELQRYQNLKFKFKEVKEIYRYFENLPDQTEKEFSDKSFKQSLLLEPRNATRVP